MAKAKKAKCEEQRDGENSNSDAVVKHQKLCLSIDIEKRQIYGYTEMKIAVPDNGILGLHADNLVIEKVSVDGHPAKFEVFPHYQNLDPKDRWCVVSSTTSAADASGSVYLASLEGEFLPNLLIMCSQSHEMDDEQEEPLQTDSGNASVLDACSSLKNVKNVRIDYWVEKAETGIHFFNNFLHTDNQLRRARCWFPCMDDNLQFCCYDLEFTVGSNLVALSSGNLLHQVLTNEDPPRKTYVYQLDVAVPAHLITLTVAPFEILANQHVGVLTHFCLPSNLSKMRNTVAFFHNVFSQYEDYLSAPFPFGTYKQVFILPEMTVSSWSLGASISIFSSHLLYDEKHLDQTIETRIKLAYALARQWFGVYITPEDPSDEWLMDGLAGFLTDTFIKRFLGNNEARYRRYKANYAVCQADDSGATALSSPLTSKDLFGTQCIGFYGKIRSWKSVAVLQMLEKQMGPESFRKILQNIVLRARDGNHSLRSLSTKEFRHYANKIGNLERPFLKEFFPRWVGSCGCPVLKMGFSYNKRKNMVELAVLRGCTSRPDSWVGVDNKIQDPEVREGTVGWPGMMSVRVHELDGMYDHPILPMSGEPWQLLEIQCHSKLAAKRFQKPKKGSKTDGSEDNVDAATTDLRSNSDTPLLWLRADPEMEYLAELQFSQPVQMWIHQLEKDKDVVAQAQAIVVLQALPQLLYPVVNALSNFLNDSKAFWRVRIQAAYALATTACEETDWAGLLHLINFYKSKRFDPKIGLPRPNDFNDFQEYFVLQAIPHAIALVRSSDKKSPREAIEFILQLLKYNDNSGNSYSDVFWVAALVQSIGELEFGEQGIVYLPSLLKRLDRLLQFDRLMPSHNGVLTVSCIESLTQIAIKLSEFLPLDNIFELINPYRSSKTWQIRVAASRALLELEFHSKGTDSALALFIKYLDDEPSLRGQAKLSVCTLRLCQMSNQLGCDNGVKSHTLVALLLLLESSLAFNNITLRHYVFCILQVLARRAPTVYGVPKDETLRVGHPKTSSELKNIFAALIKQSKTPEQSELPVHLLGPESYSEMVTPMEKNEETLNYSVNPAPDSLLFSSTLQIVDVPAEDGSEQRNPEPEFPDHLMALPVVKVTIEDQQPIEDELAGNNGFDTEVLRKDDILTTDSQHIEAVIVAHDAAILPAATVPSVPEVKKTKLKIRVKHSAVTIQAEDLGNDRTLNRDGPNDADHVASSSVSVDAPQKNLPETSNLNIDDANSCQDVGSRVTAGDELVKELQCTADSSKVSLSQLEIGAETELRIISPQLEISLTEPSVTEKEKKRKKSSHKDDPVRKEMKKQKKEKKRKEKDVAKLLTENPKTHSPFELAIQERSVAGIDSELKPPPVGGEEKQIGTQNVAEETRKQEVVPSNVGGEAESDASRNRSDGNVAAKPSGAPPSHRIKIKFKNRTLGKS